MPYYYTGFLQKIFEEWGKIDRKARSRPHKCMCLQHALSVVGLLQKIMDMGCLIMYMYICSLKSLKGGGRFPLLVLCAKSPVIQIYSNSCSVVQLCSCVVRCMDKHKANRPISMHTEYLQQHTYMYYYNFINSMQKHNITSIKSN